MSVTCVCHYFEFLFKPLKKLLFANSGEPDQTPRFAASDLVMHCLPMSRKKVAMLIWVNLNLASKCMQFFPIYFSDGHFFSEVE